MDARAGEWAVARTDLRFRYGTEFGQNVSRLDLREAYVDLTAGPAGFRFGKLITPWGKGTLFNPTGKMTPLDPTVRSPEEDDMKLGSWALEGRVSLGSHMRLSATWKPIYRSSVLLIDPVPLPEYVAFQSPAFPGPELEEGSYGIRYDLFTSRADLSLYWVDGYHHWPGLAYESLTVDTLTLEPESLSIREEAYRIRMAGLDLAIPLGSWIIRAEGAWQQTVEDHTTREYLPFPEISYTAEIERAGTYLNLVGGYYGKYILDFTPAGATPTLSADQEMFYQLMQKGIIPDAATVDGMVTGQVDAFNRLYNYQLEEFYHTTFLVAKGFLWHDQLEITVPVIYHITTGEWIIQPGISYKPADGLNISAGYTGLIGPDDSLHDLVGPVLNAGYLSLKVIF